jgi:3-methyladenine DNA glycosylase/8-oxoguanine DNA glycosylase
VIFWRKFAGIVETDAFLTRLCEIPGIGKWTAQYVAMRALGEPDAFPSGDLGLLRALALENSRELEERAEAWRPWRAYAAMYLWNTASDRKAESSASGALWKVTTSQAAEKSVLGGAALPALR